IDVALQLTIMPDRKLRRDDFFVRLVTINIAEVDQAVTTDAHLLTRFECCILLDLEEMRADDPHCKQHQAQMHNVATIALTITIEEHIHGKRIGFPVLMAY